MLPFQIAVDRVLIGFLRDVNAVDMQPFVLAVIVAATALLTLYVVRKGGWRIVAILALPAAMFCATLASSVVSLTEPQWPLLLKTGDRYFVLPSIVWAATLIAAASYAASRYGATVKNLLFGCGLILLGVTLTSKFHIPAHPDMNWQGSVAAYKAAEDNTIVDLPIVPRGWAIQLPSGLER